MKKYYAAIEEFHKKFKMKGTNNEDMNFRLNLMLEELGELAQAVTKGKKRSEILEENIDILILTIGNFVSLGVKAEKIEELFDKKIEKIMNRKKKKVNGKYRISNF